MKYLEKVFQIITLSLVALQLTHATNITCEFNPPPWGRGKSYILSRREKLVPAIYDHVDVFVDTVDITVSRSITNTGSWGPRNLRTFARFVSPGNTVLNLGSHIGL